MIQTNPLADHWSSQTVATNGVELSVWPKSQTVFPLSETPKMFQTRFADCEQYHPELIKRLLDLEHKSAFTHRMPIGGSKIRDVRAWGCPAAELVHQRAIAFFSLLMNKPDPTVDLGWANISRKGEYLSPHSHDKSVGSVVYIVDPGDPDPTNPLSGRLSFADPRIAGCCVREEGCVTMEVSPSLEPGTMVIFPSQMVHFVHTYTGERPRITIAWNLV